MPERKPYLLRIPSDLLDELALWAKDDLRSLNAQIEYVLRDALRRRRGKEKNSAPPGTEDSDASS